MTTKKIFITAIGVALVGVFLAGGAMLWLLAHRDDGAIDEYETMRLRINGESLFVRVPLSAAQQAKGLSGVTKLDAQTGMLWKYASPQMVTFWMKDMHIPLDFIWIRDQAVIGLTTNVPPPATPVDMLQLYHPPSAVDRVLEVNGGYAAAHHIVVGTTITEFAF